MFPFLCGFGFKLCKMRSNLPKEILLPKYPTRILRNTEFDAVEKVAKSFYNKKSFA
jgi:hypothetical protein